MEGRPTILVVDDDRCVLDMLEVVLRMNHYVVWSATSASEAIDIFREQSIELVLSDVNMPVQMGPELIRQLQKVDPNPRFYFMTAGDLGKYTMQDLLESGASLAIQKPFSMTSLLSFLDEVRHETRSPSSA